MGRKRLPDNLRKTGLIVNILWSTYHKLESEGQVNEVASKIIEQYVLGKKNYVDDINKME